jgi:hypothetical protein
VITLVEWSRIGGGIGGVVEHGRRKVDRSQCTATEKIVVVIVVRAQLSLQL